MANIFSEAKWIWRKNALDKPEFVIFRKKINFEKKPKKLTARIACSTRYFFNIGNKKKDGKFVVRNGGMTSNVADYYDQVDISKFVTKGENVFVFICEHTPVENGGALNASPKFIFEAVSSDKVVLSSDATFECAPVSWVEFVKDSATFSDSFWQYDATLENSLDGLMSLHYASNIFSDAEEQGAYDESVLPLSLRPIPAFAFSEKPVKAKPVKTSTVDKNIYTVKFDEHKRVYPAFSFHSDRAKTEILFYGEHPEKNQKYIGKMNENHLAFPYFSVMGDRLVVETPKDIKLKKLTYHTLRFGEDMKAVFDCSDPVLNAIFKKSASTLSACISDRFVSVYSAPSSDFFDCVVAARDLMMAYGEGGVSLVRKQICDTLIQAEKSGMLKQDALYRPNEDPFSGLLCCSEFGFFAAYTDSYGDLDKRIYDCVVKYLANWKINNNGLVVSRIDAHVETDNFDVEVTENVLYYSCLRYAKELASRNGIEDTSFIDNSMNLIKNAIVGKFFNGSIFSSGKVCDDRANAFAVLTDLTPDGNKDVLAAFLSSAQNASIYTECYIIEALCKLGRHRLAAIRLKNRYYSIARNASPSMPENFWLEGEQCCLHSAMPIYTLLACFGGVTVKDGGKKVVITPAIADLDYMKFSAMTPDGKIKGDYYKDGEKTVLIIDNDTKLDAMVIVYNVSGDVNRTIKLMKGKNKIVME